MLRRIRSLVLILIAAIAGAACGRAFAQMRAQQHPAAAGTVEGAAGTEGAAEPAAETRGGSLLRIRPQEVVPGIVAAFRVGEPPWSWLHIPGWLVAFAVNLGTTAFGGQLHHLREMVEQGDFSFAEFWSDDAQNGHDAPAWTVEEQPGTPTH
ncbi:MAG: hypothetical protein FJZ92_09055 [Chloroflexi bacterium]|nr:hypothetical protein [Chloroflexota bacterium]